ncbi:peptidase S41, partial [bacterium]|nr:peptidase S41 [bacterium]
MARRLLSALLIFLLVVTGAGYAYAAENQSEGKDVINEVFDYLIKYHKDNPKAKQLVEGAIWGMIDTLDDPYT